MRAALTLVLLLQLSPLTLAQETQTTEASAGGDSPASPDSSEAKDLPKNISCSNGTDPFCASCQNSKCTVCYSSQNIQGICKPIKNAVQHCMEYDSSGNCSYCQYGYYLSEDLCVKSTLKNCFTHHISDSSKCGVCNGYVLNSDGVCDENRPCSGDQCRSCIEEQGEQTCLWCNDGYILKQLDSFTCVKADGMLRNCFSLDADGNCSACHFGYYIDPTIEDTSVCVKSTEYNSSSRSGAALLFLLLCLGFN